ncbi:MAG TPA: tetratricopeptide repeat protein [Sphingomicrobium sp.]|nr:tetratricopeptide repeat protein [Sphingomicrobium sp.]
MEANIARRTLLLALATAVPASSSAMGNSSPHSVPSVNAPQFDAADEYRKGVEALKASKFSEAKRAFAQVLDVSPRDANTNFLAGLADAGLNDLKGAQKHYERAVRADDRLIPAQQELAITYAKLGDATKAEATLTKLRNMDSSCAGSCKEAEELKTAISAVEAAIGQPTHAALNTTPPLLFESAKGGDSAYLQAVSLINEKRYAEAIEALQRARATFGAHPDVLTYLGFANRKLGRYDVAVGYYHQALAAAPNHKGATEYYGELLVERGDLVAARRMLAKLDTICTFGCAEAEELRRWVQAKGQPAS